MATPVLVVTPSPTFGESVRASLEQTESYRVFIVSNKVPAIIRAEEESCRLAILDMDLGEQWVEDIGRALRKIVPELKLFVLAGDELPPVLDGIRPWTLLRKPFHLSQALVALARPESLQEPTKAETRPHGELPWLTDVSTAAQHLTRLTLESSSQAALIVRNNELWAYAGALVQAAAQEVAAVMLHNWESETDGDLLRFVRLEATRAEHILYATPLAPGMLLGLVFDAETPFGTIRSQAGKLGSLLDREKAGPASEAEVVSTTPLTWAAGPGAPGVDQVQSIDMENGDDAPIPEIQNILQDVPTPEPHPLMQTTPPMDPEATRRTAAPRLRAAGLLGNKGLSQDVGESTGAEVAGPVSRPATPVAPPRPVELEHTLPHSLIGFAGMSADARRINLEPVQAGVYHLTYACLLLPRFADHYLTGEVADKLSEWMPIICIAFGWRLEYLAVRPEYLQWVSNVAPATSPGYVMRIMRTQTSEKIFAGFPGLRKDNPSGDFWAPGYLIMGGTQPHPSQLVKDYIKQARERQGNEIPKR